MLQRLFITALLLVVSVCQVSAGQDIVATVGGVPITEAEVKRQMDKVMPFRVSFHGRATAEKLAAIRTDVVDGLIERAYKVCYAVEQEISVPAEQIDTALAQVKSLYKTAADFKKAVEVETEAGLRASIYRDLVAKKAELIAIDEQIDVSESAVEKQYKENRQMYFMPMQFQASHILVKVDPSSNIQQRADLLAKAERLFAQAKAGEDFYNLAYYNSDDRTKYVGGDLGLFHEGQTAEPFEAALKRMQVGEISGPIKTRWGYHIIKLLQKNEARQMPFEEMKAKIKAQLVKQQREQHYQQWLAELKGKYKVEMRGE